MSIAVKDTTIGGPRNFKISLHEDGNFKMPGMHYHDAYEIYILEDGERLYLLEDKLIHLRSRDVLLIKRNIVHCTIGGIYRKSAMEFTEEYLRKFFSNYGIELATRCFEKNVIRVRESDFPQILSIMEKLSENNEDMLSLTHLFILLESNISRKTYDLQSINHLAADIVDYVTENYKTIDNLDTVASKFYISKQHLCNLFKQYTNTTIIKYVNLLKVHAAIELIAEKKYTMAEVALKSGFNSLRYFSETFKNITGISPLKYSKTGSENKNKP